MRQGEPVAQTELGLVDGCDQASLDFGCLAGGWSAAQSLPADVSGAGSPSLNRGGLGAHVATGAHTGNLPGPCVDRLYPPGSSTPCSVGRWKGSVTHCHSVLGRGSCRKLYTSCSERCVIACKAWTRCCHMNMNTTHVHPTCSLGGF